MGNASKFINGFLMPNELRHEQAISQQAVVFLLLMGDVTFEFSFFLFGVGLDAEVKSGNERQGQQEQSGKKKVCL